MITMDYTNFLNTAPAGVSTILNNDSWSPATNSTIRLNAAIGIMDQAVSNIQGLFSGCTVATITQTIAVGWSSHLGNTLAMGGTSKAVLSIATAIGLLNLSNG